MDLLEEKVQLLAQFTRAIEQLRKLLQVTPQAVQFFTDIAAFRKERGLLREARGFDGDSAEQFLQPGFQPPRKGPAQRGREPAHLPHLAAYSPQAISPLFP